MKAKKAISRVLAAAVVSAALFPLSACSSRPVEADRADGVYVSEYFTSMSSAIGIRISFDFEGCTITLTTQSDKGYFYLDQFQEEYCTDWDNLPIHSQNEWATKKRAYPENMPVHFENQANIQWVLIDDEDPWWNTVVEDYIIAVAEKEGYITGYAVVHIITGNHGGISAIVANKEFPMKNGKYQDVDREWLDGRIQTLITEYETAEKENGGQAS